MVEIQEYIPNNGTSPFAQWFESLDTQAALKINTYLTRIACGNNSNLKAIGAGLIECKIDWVAAQKSVSKTIL